jgi:hypothetical protein
VSEIFGLELRIATADGETLLRGEFEPAAFMDIWDRGADGSAAGDMAAGAMYQSVLTHLTWGDVERSPFLGALRDAARAQSRPRGRLSVKFNVDGFSMTPGARFMMGRLVGTIGPAGVDEPRHFVARRPRRARRRSACFRRPSTPTRPGIPRPRGSPSSRPTGR